jgi:hypothetical protein
MRSICSFFFFELKMYTIDVYTYQDISIAFGLATGADIDSN